MSKRFSKLGFISAMIVLILSLVAPSAFAESSNQEQKKSLSQAEVDNILSASSLLPVKNIVPASEENFKKISERVQYYKKTNPTRDVDVNQILSELNLSNLTIVTEEQFEKASKRNQVYNKSLIEFGSIGFHSYVRDTGYFKSRAHVRNLSPIGTIDQISGYVAGYNIIPSTTCLLINQK